MHGQPGYLDIFSQRNVDLVRYNLGSLFNGAKFANLPNFLIHNPGPDPEPYYLELQQTGMDGFHFDLFDQNGKLAPLGTEMMFAAGESQSFFLQISQTAANSPTGGSAFTPPLSTGSDSYVDVIPYAIGQLVMVDGNQSAVRFAFEAPQVYLPMISH